MNRLTDEVAAYLAQIAYLLLLIPSVPEPPIGTRMNNMTRQAMRLVNSYELGSPAGIAGTFDKVQGVSYENYVTSDKELLTLFVGSEEQRFGSQQRGRSRISQHSSG